MCVADLRLFVPVVALLLVAAAAASAGEDDALPEVELGQGRVRGVRLRTSAGVDYEAFLGIPYARPPLQELRFQDPQPAAPWIGVYNATAFGSDCLQFTHFGYSVVGDEDCLFLNVYRPRWQEKNNVLRDVIVYIHGGAFMFLSGQYYKPPRLMEKGLIYVSLNYRLGPLGFLSTGDRVLPGNAGLKDQAAALRWVRANVRRFGGDPDSVTVAGMSAGGASVHYHYLSPSSRGLFQRGISMSGSVLNPWPLTEAAPQKARRLAEALGCPAGAGDSAGLVACLRTRPARQIVSRVPDFMAFLYNPYTPFGPVIEPEDAENAFLTRHPYDVIKEGRTAQVPWLASFTTEEGLYPAAEFVENEEILNSLEKNWTDLAPHLLDYNFTVRCKSREEVADKIRREYFHGKTVPDSVTELVQVIGDRLFGAGITQAALMQAAARAPVYMYRFGYRGKNSLSKRLLNAEADYGVSHGDDTAYVLQLVMRTDETEEDRAMQKRMVNLWSTFAKTGVPEFFDGKPLPPVGEGLPELRYLEIRSPTDATVETVQELAHMKFWESLPLKEELHLPKSFRSQDEL